MESVVPATMKARIARQDRRRRGAGHVAASAVLVCTLFGPAPSMGQPSSNGIESTRPGAMHTDPSAIGFGPAPQLQNRPRSDFENALMSEFACTCGGCKLELINACRCGFAAKMRGELLAQLDSTDLSSETARRAAAEAVRASFVASYGPKVLDRTNRLDPNGRIAGFVVGGVFLLILGVIGRRFIRGGQGSGRDGA